MTVSRRASVILPDDRCCSEREKAFERALERVESLRPAGGIEPHHAHRPER